MTYPPRYDNAFCALLFPFFVYRVKEVLRLLDDLKELVHVGADGCKPYPVEIAE